MLSWGDNGLPVANAGFKYYWAFSVPLTLLVLFIWAVATWLPWEKWLSRWRRRSAALELDGPELIAAQSLEKG
jgi:hypothetical protein